MSKKFQTNYTFGKYHFFFKSLGGGKPDLVETQIKVAFFLEVALAFYTKQDHLYDLNKLRNLHLNIEIF